MLVDRETEDDDAKYDDDIDLHCRNESRYLLIRFKHTDLHNTDDTLRTHRPFQGFANALRVVPLVGVGRKPIVIRQYCANKLKFAINNLYFSTCPTHRSTREVAKDFSICHLIHLSRNLLDALSVKSLFESVTERLFQENNLGVNRAAQFVANRMSGKE